MNAQPDVDQPGNTSRLSAGSHNVLRGADDTPQVRVGKNRFKRAPKTTALAIAALAVLVSFGAVAGWFAQTQDLVIQGEVKATEIKVVPTVAGKVKTLHVSKGDKVCKGQPLVTLENQDLQARLQQARKALECAKTRDEKIRSACVEDIAAQSNCLVKAKAIVERTEQAVTHARALQADNVISLQELEALERDLDWARSCERAAKASLDLAIAVFGKEGELIPASDQEQATHRVAELEPLIPELVLKSPIDGEVQDQNIGQGDLVTVGTPVLMVVDRTNLWMRFSFPKYLLSKIQVGTILHVAVPLLAKRDMPVQVIAVSHNEDFAAKPSAQESGSSDGKTFEVRVVPLQHTDGLRSGMIALAIWKESN